MSEGAPFCLSRSLRDRKLLSVGNPVPETEIEIVDLEKGDRVLPLGERGEVRVRGPQIMQDYRNRPDETSNTLRDGWIYTGDIGYVDDDGFLFLVDRKKDMVIVGGFNVYPREVDEVLFNHPKIREAATVGKRDARLGEVLVGVCSARSRRDDDGRRVLRVLQRADGQVQAASRGALRGRVAEDGDEQDQSSRFARAPRALTASGAASGKRGGGDQTTGMAFGTSRHAAAHVRRAGQ